MTDRATELRLETGGEQWCSVTRVYLYPGAPCYLAAVSVKCPSSGDCVCTLGSEVIRFIVILSFVYRLCCVLRRSKVKTQVGGRQVRGSPVVQGKEIVKD